MSLNLIENALKIARQRRIEYQTDNTGIFEPLTPKARYNILYLRVRETLNEGCRGAVKLIPEAWKRSVAYSVLMKATYAIFAYGYRDDIITLYNNLLDETIGTH